MSNEEGSSSQAVYNQEINAEELKPLLKILIDRVENRKTRDNFSPIYKVPSRLRDVNPSSFIPRVVSIGPMHNGRPNLKLMEDKKPTYMYTLLRDVDSPYEETLTRCMEKVNNSLQQIKKYYFGLEEKFGDQEFVLIMVTDACFIIQFIRELYTSDNIYSNNRLRSRYVAMDLVLLENQIPFFVLQDIYDLTLRTFKPEPDLITMLRDLLERVNPFFKKISISTLENRSGEKPRYHILGLLHEFYQPGESFVIPRIEAITTAHHSVVDLHKVGVKFKSNLNMNWIMDMKFEQSSHKPRLKMPNVLIDNFFEVVMRNLIAYEQYSFSVENHVTSYAMAMDSLAATPADIAKLGEAGIIKKNLGSNEKASNMISSICKDVTFHDFYYIESWKEIEKHYESYWSKNYGVFKRKNFSTPWKAIALIVAIIVFFIAVVQFSIRMKTYARTHRI